MVGKQAVKSCDEAPRIAVRSDGDGVEESVTVDLAGEVLDVGLVDVEPSVV